MENGGVPAETPTPSPQEESRASDTPLRSESESEHGASAGEAEEQNRDYFPKGLYTIFLLLKSSTVDERNYT